MIDTDPVVPFNGSGMKSRVALCFASWTGRPGVDAKQVVTQIRGIKERIYTERSGRQSRAGPHGQVIGALYGSGAASVQSVTYTSPL
jgi:hypothetical protein